MRYATPLRYPGGKQRVAPFIRETLAANDLLGGQYSEPYAGGAGVAISLLLSGDVESVILNDSSAAVFSFWQAILKHPEEFCARVSSASLTIDEWKRQRDILRRPDEHDVLELGFSTFFLNRCNRSGILTGGVIGGLEQNGPWKLDARFPRNRLISRIEAIADHASSITVTNRDAEAFIRDTLPVIAQEKCLVYCDPPYYECSRRLYLDGYSTEDHERLAGVIQEELNLPWLVSYNADARVKALYGDRVQFDYPLRYSAASSSVGQETFIFSDELSLPCGSAVTGIDHAIKTLYQAGTI